MTASAPTRSASVLETLEQLQGVRAHDRRRDDSSAVTRVLVVEDDPSTLALMTAVIRRQGSEVVSTESADAALRYLKADGTHAFDCVLTDHQMPGVSGLELLAHIRGLDPTLAVVLITASRARETIVATLRGGAAGFLDKPIVPEEVARTLREAVRATRQARAARTHASVVREVGRLQRRAMQLGERGDPRLTIRFHPCHEAGGDFITTFNRHDGGLLVLVADVSGHDVSSAFTAAYFQGLVRGMKEAGGTVDAVMHRFNRVLLEEWIAPAESRSAGGIEVGISVSACAIALDADARTVHITDAGAPAPWYIDEIGRVTNLDRGRSQPLGWFADSLPQTASYAMRGGSILAWTDGLDDIASEHGLPSIAAATALLRSDDAWGALLRHGTRDDVLVAHLAVRDNALPSSDGAESTFADHWLPILAEQYSAAQLDEIDALQQTWERCLQYVVPELAESRMVDILVAVREATINGLLHGCAGAADRHTQLQLVFSPTRRILRAFVEDPGAGHDFDYSAHESGAGDELVDLHRGLSMIHGLASSVTVEGNGARLRLDFRF